MPARPPPLAVVRFVEKFLGPGFFRRWVDIANAAYLEAGASGVFTSWYRDPASNAAVGGSPNSQHLYGLAFDLDYGVPDHRESPVVAAASQSFRRRGFVPVAERSHLHVQTYPAR